MENEIWEGKERAHQRGGNDPSVKGPQVNYTSITLSPKMNYTHDYDLFQMLEIE